MKDATQFHIRPARPEEAGLFYTPHPEEDKRLGTVGHVRMDFGRSGNEFWHTWWPRGPEELNSGLQQRAARRYPRAGESYENGFHVRLEHPRCGPESL